MTFIKSFIFYVLAQKPPCYFTVKERIGGGETTFTIFNLGEKNLFVIKKKKWKSLQEQVNRNKKY